MNKFIRTEIETLLRNKAALDTALAAAVTNIVLDGIAAAIAGKPPGLPRFGERSSFR
jgi:hypothetical protein